MIADAQKRTPQRWVDEPLPTCAGRFTQCVSDGRSGAEGIVKGLHYLQGDQTIDYDDWSNRRGDTTLRRYGNKTEDILRNSRDRPSAAGDRDKSQRVAYGWRNRVTPST
jgi:hypothetical protein